MVIKKNKTFNLILLVVVVIQIILLINMVVANSYSISQKNQVIEKGINVNKKNKLGELGKLGINLLIGFLSIKQIGVVSAQELPDMQCCIKLKSGAICQDILDTESNLCEVPLLPTLCESLNMCRHICCIDTNFGTCDPETPYKECEESGGHIEEEPNCEIQYCQMGCCYLGDSGVFMTQKRCEFESESWGVETNFDPGITSEIDCIMSAQPEEKGACVFEEDFVNTCFFGTNAECVERGGTWHKGLLCTNDGLDTDCEPTKETTCIEGEEEVYFIDSKNNPANIYDADKTYKKDPDYWQRVYTKEESCELNVDNFEDEKKDCGNCYRPLSICANYKEVNEDHPRLGENICRDLNCHDAPLNGFDNDGNRLSGLKYNTESWCIFDGSIGEAFQDELFEDPKLTSMKIYIDKYCFPLGNGEFVPNPDNCEEAAFENALDSGEGGFNFPNSPQARYYSRYCTSPTAGENCKNDLEEYYDVTTKSSNFATDPVGSEHWLAQCNDGEVIIEQHSNYRDQVCQESVLEGENPPEITWAELVENTGDLCYSYNEEEDAETLCRENPHCMIKYVNMKGKIVFDICVPRYPGGQPLFQSYLNSEAEPTDEGVCSTLSLDCEYSKSQKVIGHKRKEQNKICTQAIFRGQLNDLCISMGDCGSYVNWVGEGTDNYINKHGYHGSIWENYIDYATPVEGQRVAPFDIYYLLGLMMGTGDINYENEEEAYEDMLGYMAGIPGGLGALAFGGLVLLNGFSLAIEILSFSGGAGALLSTGTYFSGILGTFSTAAIGMAIGVGLAYWLAKSLGVDAETAKYIMIFGGLGGLIAGIIYAFGWNPWGYVVAAIFAAIGALIGLLEWEEEISGYTVKYRCLPWQAPYGGADCEKCNEDELSGYGKYCTEYMCNSLGQECKYLNGDTDAPICIWDNKYDTTPPEIYASHVITEGYDFENEVESKSVEIKRDTDNGCIREFQTVQYVLNTTEPAACVGTYAIPGYDFESMLEDPTLQYPLEQNLLTWSHTFIIQEISIEMYQDYFENIELNNLLEKFGEITLHVKCRDGHEPPNFNRDPYKVKFCVNDEDIEPVNHGETVFDPPSESYLKWEETEQILTMWINEPAECKYSKTSGVDFDIMESEMDCKIGLNDKGINGWPCQTKLTELTEQENHFYFKCKDKPWTGVPEEDRKVNTQDHPYVLYGSVAPLEISSTSPSGVLIAGEEPVVQDIEVQTIGGAKGDGFAECSFEWGGQSIYFPETGTNIHRQLNWQFFGNEYNIPVSCIDEAENVGEGSIDVDVQIDNEGPIVVRAYNDGSLIIETNELAKCYANNINACQPFNEDNATSMTTAWSTKHSIAWDPSRTYYIKCIDQFDNWSPGCAIIVRPGVV